MSIDLPFVVSLVYPFVSEDLFKISSQYVFSDVGLLALLSTIVLHPELGPAMVFADVINLLTPTGGVVYFVPQNVLENSPNNDLVYNSRICKHFNLST